MSLKAVVRYINYRFKQNEDDFLYKALTAEYQSVLCTGIFREVQRISYVEEHNKIYGIKTKKDERTAREIVEDTFKKHGIKMRKKEA